MTEEFEFGGLQWGPYNAQCSTQVSPDQENGKHGYWVEPFEDGFIISIYYNGILKGHCALDFFIAMCRHTIKQCPVCQLQGVFEWKDCSEFSDILCEKHSHMGKRS
jgi:hypothetical protein